MKKLLSFAVGAAMFFGIASTQQLKAQVYADYDVVIKDNVPYKTLKFGDAGVDSLHYKRFGMMPTRQTDKDNGYAGVTLPFDFTYNGVKYKAGIDSLYICVNGFVTFNIPPSVIADSNKALFKIENSYPDNVLAPFWGDHVYRTKEDNDLIQSNTPGANKYAVTTILTGKIPSTNPDTFVIEWRNLNILDRTSTSCVASFQIRFIKDPTTQGPIEFAYGLAGKLPGQETTDNTLKVNNAVIGIKGESGILHNTSDYLNLLAYDRTKDSVTNKTNMMNSTVLSTNWQPTGGSDKRFRLIPIVRYSIANKWGDGDADMSRVSGGAHVNIPEQNRFVTVNDVREIMTSMSNRIPLDSINGRAAFHGDINHNGRFIYRITGSGKEKVNILTKSKEYNQDLPLQDIGNEKQIMFQVTEYDAALIMHYLAGRLPLLPWTLDFVPIYGKVDANTEGIVFGTPELMNNGSCTMPVYANGKVNGPIAAKFDVNGVIENVIAIDNNGVATEFKDNRLVLAGSTKSNSGEAICYVTFRPNTDNIKVTNITYNDVDAKDVDFSLASVDNSNTNNMLANYPNPFAQSTSISVNVENSGFYTLNIYDVDGNLVKTLVNGNLDAGQKTPILWDGTNNSGSKVQSGMYIYRLIGDNISVSNTMQLIK